MKARGSSYFFFLQQWQPLNGVFEKRSVDFGSSTTGRALQMGLHKQASSPNLKNFNFHHHDVFLECFARLLQLVMTFFTK